ncbi:hypothetical protein ACTJIL_05270 [Luteimonas sp. 22616]|uniref:hypothetical protein n=1 Tax=Luteimonas sp. 22616 TaxID=3453951 RepID=UPI003F85E087
MNDDKRNHPDGERDDESGNPPAPAPGPSTYRWLRRNTKRLATFAMLLHGLKASRLDVLAGARTYRGAAVVLALKESGFPIVSELRPHRTANGAATRIAYYSVPATERAHILADTHRKAVWQ